jgi:translation initiation factor eIF-2B subunit epsilon
MGSNKNVNSLHRTQCLLPLLDVPLLAWTLECLATSGVEEIFIFVNNGIEEVRTWLA